MRMSGFEILYDMFDHEVVVSRNDGRQSSFAVPGLTVSQFYETLFSHLSDLGITVRIVAVPYDNKSRIPFREDHAPRAYDTAAVSGFWARPERDFECLRGLPVPLHRQADPGCKLYWHSFDLVVTRFSGRAHPLEGGTQSDREAYSHEVISIGFWPGDDSFPEAAFYGYAYREPDAMNAIPLQPAQAFWAEKNGGALAILKYEDARNAADPAEAISVFLESLYQGAAEKADWPVEDLKHIYR